MENTKSEAAATPHVSVLSVWSDACKNLLQQGSIYGIAAGFCISASLLSIINKWAVMKFPYPGALTASQYFTSALGVLLRGWFKLVEHDQLDLKTMWKFLPAAIIFCLFLFTNEELLLNANGDTFIVFRSIVPVFVAVGNNTWGILVYNLEALFLFPLELLRMGELKKIKHEIQDESDWHALAVVVPVILSRLFGLDISFFGFSCRKSISATGFTVLGIVNKLLSVIINFTI